MAIFTSITQIYTGEWEFTWDAFAAIYRVVLNGELLEEITTTTYTIDGTEYEDYPPPIEVVAVGEVALSETHKPFIIFQWHAVEGAVEYEIERYIGGAWVVVQRQTDNGSAVYAYTTPVMDDDTFAQYRVQAIDEYESESIAQEFETRIVCPPPVPVVGVAYNETSGQIVVGG